MTRRECFVKLEDFIVDLTLNAPIESHTNSYAILKGVVHCRVTGVVHCRVSRRVKTVESSHARFSDTPQRSEHQKDNDSRPKSVFDEIRTLGSAFSASKITRKKIHPVSDLLFTGLWAYRYQVRDVPVVPVLMNMGNGRSNPNANLSAAITKLAQKHMI
jgi:hypothetical protein